MNNEDRRQVIEEAMELLAQAEELVSSLDDSRLNAYVSGHINASGRYLGDGLYQTLENSLRED